MFLLDRIFFLFRLGDKEWLCSPVRGGEVIAPLGTQREERAEVLNSARGAREATRRR